MGTIQKILKYLICTALIVSLTILALPAQAQDLEVEVQTGPTFKDDDAGKAESCTITVLKDKFPFDFLEGSIGSGSGCPEITLFGFRNELCWIVDIYLKIRPAVIASMLIYGIFHW